MTRKECLDAAAGCVLKDRQNQYGGPEDNFGRIATMWNGYLGTNSIKPWDVAAMMGMLKMARARFNPKHADNWVDLAGYAACGVECATAQEEFDKALDEFQKKSMEHMFKPGDRVQFRDEIPSTSEPHWFDGAYVKRLPDGGHAISFGPNGHVIHCSDEEIRLAPKEAEGCEELVQDVAGECRNCTGFKDGPVPERCDGCMKTLEADAPQTKEELIERIKSANPAIYGAHIE